MDRTTVQVRYNRQARPADPQTSELWGLNCSIRDMRHDMGLHLELLWLLSVWRLLLLA